jgi:peroxiredoxin
LEFYSKFNTDVCGTCIHTFERLLEDLDEANGCGIDVSS